MHALLLEEAALTQSTSAGTNHRRAPKEVTIIKIKWKDGAPQTDQPRTPLINQAKAAKLSVQCRAAVLGIV
jgi:hypothetical protein